MTGAHCVSRTLHPHGHITFTVTIHDMGVNAMVESPMTKPRAMKYDDHIPFHTDQVFFHNCMYVHRVELSRL